MGESSKRKKERRREVPKTTAKLAPLPLSTDAAVAGKQRAFCKAIVENILEDDSSLSFSKPVRELWDVAQLEGYFERVKEPMDLGTVRTNLDSKTHYIAKDTQLFDPNAYRVKIRLVFWNAMDFNGKGTDLYRLANKFLQFVDSKLTELPGLEVPDDDQGATTNAPEAKADKDGKAVKDKDAEVKEEEATDEKSEQPDADRPDEEMKHDDVDENDNDDSGAEEEAEKMNRQIASMEKHRARAKANLAELELMRNVPLTHEENAKLRDDIESLTWDKAKKVVKILRKYVDEALADINEEDPEFVTLELTVVEPHLLRDIESLIRPDPRQDEEKKKIANLDEEIGTLKRKLKRISSGDNGSRKKPRRRR